MTDDAGLQWKRELLNKRRASLLEEARRAGSEPGQRFPKVITRGMEVAGSGVDLGMTGQTLDVVHGDAMSSPEGDTGVAEAMPCQPVVVDVEHGQASTSEGIT